MSARPVKWLSNSNNERVFSDKDNKPFPWRWLVLDENNKVMIDFSSRNEKGELTMPQLTGIKRKIVQDSVEKNNWKYATQSQIEQYINNQPITS